MFCLMLFSCKVKEPYTRIKGKGAMHHHGFFSTNDKATRRNERMKRKTSKAGDSKKTSVKKLNKEKAKAKAKKAYVKTFDHH